MPNVRYPPIPKPAAEVRALALHGDAVKETLEIMSGQRGNRFDAVVTWQDLVDLGLILPTQVPT